MYVSKISIKSMIFVMGSLLTTHSLGQSYAYDAPKPLNPTQPSAPSYPVLIPGQPSVQPNNVPMGMPSNQPIAQPATQPGPTPVVMTDPNPVSIHYYAAIYSHDDGILNLPRHAHSFGSFIAFDHASGKVIDRFAISWLPADGSIRLLDGVERGRNLSLLETRINAASQGLEVRRWGPREVTLDFFMAARKQWQRLERASFDGSILYITIDPAYRDRPYQPAMNCIHALTGIVGDLETGPLHGREASAAIDRFFSRYYRSTQVVYDIHQAFLNFEEGR